MAHRKKKKTSSPYRSGFEDKFFNYVTKKKLDVSYELCSFDYVLEKTYNSDWTFYKKDGSVCIVETKGVLDQDERRKLLAVKEQHPSLDIRLVFMRDNKLHKGAKSTYSEWATKHNFPCWVVGSSSKYLPDEWVKEFK